jgi:hypothetical protein
MIWQQKSNIAALTKPAGFELDPEQKQSARRARVLPLKAS